MTAVIEAAGLTKVYGTRRALNGVTLTVAPGRIVGLIGPTGAGTTTLLKAAVAEFGAIHPGVLKAILGLTACTGSLSVLGLDPVRQRGELMREVCFIADVAVLPRWLRVRQAIDFVAGVHPRFRPARCRELLERSGIDPTRRIATLSKGMVTQLHLALVMTIDAKLLVLDEPTLGLDLLASQRFYDALLADYADRERTVLITTHQVEEVQHLLTDLVLLDQGRVLESMTMEDLAHRYVELEAVPAALPDARALGPLAERPRLGRAVLLFDGIDRARLAAFGRVCTPSLADLVVARLGATLPPSTAAGGVS